MTAIPADSSSTTAPDWLPNVLESTWHLFSIHPAMLFLAIFLTGLVVALAGRYVVLLWGVKLVGRGDTERARQLFSVLARLFFIVVVMLSLIVAVQSLPVSDSLSRAVVRVLATLLVLQMLITALKLSRLGLQLLGRIRDRYHFVEERTIPLFDLALTVIVVGLASYATLMIWEINPAAWLASAGVIGIAVGFAARDTLANLFAGFFIIADSPYKLGDYVVLDSGERGEVTKVGIRTTRLLTRDDIEVTIPNAEMANSKIVNESGGRWLKYRIRIKVGVAYGSDVDQVVQLLEHVTDGHPLVCADPKPRVRMRGFGDSSLDFELLCWISRPAERGRVSHELYMAIYKAMQRDGIEIPFPQRDVWIRESSSESAS